jgi:hypothetical protein
LWRVPSNLKFVFAFAPSYNILEKEPLSTLRKIEIRPISEKYFGEILRSVVSFYENAYNFKVKQKNVLERVPRDKTRTLIKGLVEALDLMRFYPDEELKELLK